MSEKIGELQEKKNEQAIAELKKFEEGLYSKLLDYLAGMTSQGLLQPTPLQLAQIESVIVNWTKELGYGKIIDNYLAALDETNEINRLYYSKETTPRTLARIENEILKSPVNEVYIGQVTDNLRGAGAYEAIVKKVGDVLRLDALRGLTFEQAAAELKALVTTTEGGAGIAERHFNQVAKDAVMQYDGLLQEELKKTFKPTRGRYFASVIETTRPICDHIKDRFGNGYITTKELQSVLNEYCPNGTPSDEKITYETVNGEVRTLKKGSGMIEGTTLENFPMNRGGYNCRHSWKWDFSSALAK